MYIYPELPSAGRTYPFFRIGGNGLANCLFVYARAISLSYNYGAKIIQPTWFNISIGPYLRRQRDKRHYLGLFSRENEICGIRKVMLLLFGKKLEIIDNDMTGVYYVKGLDHYFEDIRENNTLVSKYIINHVKPNLLSRVDNFDFSHCVAVHIRLGDYPQNLRTPIKWYIERILEKKQEGNYRFLIFSDGNDDELAEVLSINGTVRADFGSAIADIIAISKCEYLYGSDSTFSGWGAYLGQVPCRFYRKHFGRVLLNQGDETIDNDDNSNWLNR